MALELSSQELTSLRKHGLVVFEDRIIRDAQPPITDAVLAEIAARCSGQIPEGLVALWRTSFGGTLDYDLTADFGGIVASVSFRELFYPGSDGYRDLWGWIDHEAELAEAKLDYLPFGGFEYGSRMYVRVAPGPDHGAVVAWEQGLPAAWRLRLHRDATAPIGPDVAALFRALAFEDDPRAPKREYASGTALVEAIQALGDPPLERKLLDHLGSAVLDWRAALAKGALAADLRLVRLALGDVVADDDVTALGRLAEAGCDVRMQVAGGGTAVDLALIRDAPKCVRWLLDRDVPVPDGIKNGAASASLALTTELLERGAVPDVLAALAAADAGHLDVALVIARAAIAIDPAAAAKLAEQARRRADDAEKSAVSIEQKRLYSNESADDYRARARAFRDLADRVASTG